VSDATLSRRRFLQLSLGSAAVLAGGCDPGGRLAEDPFTLGVASGDPLPDRVVLWTRLAPEPLDPTGAGGMPRRPFPVVWQVAEDEAFRRVVRSGFAMAAPASGHSVHVDAAGLRPDRWYHYRFFAAGHESPVGRTRTAPAAGSSPARLRFASASCQDFKDGFYTAHAQMAREDLDLVVFLGDYIYEDGRAGSVRLHDGPRIRDLAGYRNRYALYRSDPDLREAHRLFPWVVTWDDHEVSNNYAGLLPDENGPFADFTPEAFAALRADAYRAWWEHMPVRLAPPKGSPSLRIFRRLGFGDLVELLVLDTRQHRTDQECGDPGPGPVCEGFPSPDGDLLGPVQEAWLRQSLERSGALWNVLAQQVVLAPTPIFGLLNFDQWDGYPLARQRLVDFLRERAIRNPVVLTGDIHASGVAWVPGDPVSFTDPVASEFVATGISSGGLDPGLVGFAEQALGALPHVEFFEGVLRGYLRHEVTPGTWRADVRLVQTVTSPTSELDAEASRGFVVESGDPRPQPA